MKFRFLIYAMALLALLAVAACGSEPETAEGGVAVLDTTHRDTGSPEVRLARLTEQLKFGPKNWQLWYERSLVLYEMGNLPRAMDDIEKAISYSITEPQTYHMRGFYHYVQKHDSLALKDFQRAAELNSENPETYYQIGNIKLFQNAYQDAEEAYNHAIKLDSLEPTYVFAKGLMCRQQGRVDDAIRYYNEALERDPTFIKALLALHDVYLQDKRNADQAYAYNERVLLLDSTHALAHFNQGNFFMVRAGKVTDPKKKPDYQVLMKIAISEYSTSLRFDPNFKQALYNRGYSYYLIEKYGQALADFSRLTEMDPFHRDAFYMKANIQEFQGDMASALSNYERAAEIDPNFFDAVNAVKELKMRMK